MALSLPNIVKKQPSRIFHMEALPLSRSSIPGFLKQGTFFQRCPSLLCSKTVQTLI